MSFGLKKAGATYQRLIDQTFRCQIGRNLEAYVDDLVINSHKEEEMVYDINEKFRNLRSINMKLNPKKCTFGVIEGKFMRHVIMERCLKACPDKVRAIKEMRSPESLQEVQSLNGKLAALSMYLSRSAEKTLTFFKTLKKSINNSDFTWTAHE